MKIAICRSTLQKALHRLAFALLCLPLLFLSPLSASAQSSPNDDDSVRSFVDSVAKGVYALAWPTATYRESSIHGFRLVQGGCDIYVKLSGNSAFDGSDLWMVLDIMVRNGSIADVKVQDDNHFWVAPFQTLIAAGTLAAELAKESAQQSSTTQATPAYTPAYPPLRTPQPAAPAAMAGAVCIRNPTADKVTFYYRWGTASWQTVNLDPDKSYAIWWKYDGTGRTSPQLTVRYDGDFAEGYQERTYTLPRHQSVVPVRCDQAAGYHFGALGTALYLYNDQEASASAP